VVLAAGEGTRMRSARAKVLHEVAGRPLLQWVLDAAVAAGCARRLVVVGHQADAVRERFAEAGVEWVVQRERRGTGHALLQVRAAIRQPASLLVLSGDVPLVRSATLGKLVAAAAADSWGAMAVATLAAPGALGRVFASPEHPAFLEAIVEAADATPVELEHRKVNAGLYVLPAPEVFDLLERLTPENAKGEFYLTDALGAAARRGERVRLVDLDDPEEAFGVNDRADLARAHAVLLRRHAVTLQEAGVTILAPERVSIEPSVEVAADATIHPDVTLLGSCRIGAGAVLHQGSWLRDTVVGARSAIEPYSVLDGATIGSDCRVGPFARLRPGAVLDDQARVGNFVEVKKSHLGKGAKANHLAYLGDAEVGAGANIGAGVVTCNYDGEQKHPTTIGARAFIGSDTMLVAPVAVGAEATTAAGSVITQDVPDGALGVARERQRNVPGWAKRRRKGLH
jgi:bifunctional UDP-N-acetylglucosamine pyrophosphorylase/glucosamine-1-phosphate N-acetyltransferase